MHTGIRASLAMRLDPSTPVPSSTIATAPSATARRTFAIARRGERALSRRLTRSSTVPSFVPIGPVTAAPSSTPRALVSPTYGVFENGALTTIVSARLAPESLPPQPMARRIRASPSASASRRRRTANLPRSAEVGGAHSRIGGDVVRRSRREALTGVEHDDIFGDRTHEAEVVLDDDYGETFLRQPLQDAGQPVEILRSCACGRLVEEQDARLRREGRGDHQQPLLRTRERLSELVRPLGEADDS